MFSTKIINSDAFNGLSFAAQALYLRLAMEADDDGFLNCARTIARGMGVPDEDMQSLYDKRFLLDMGDGITVIKHWNINNHIRKDRKQDTQYSEEKERLTLKDNGAYSLVTAKCDTVVNQATTTRQPGDNHSSTKTQPKRRQKSAQNSIGEDSIDTKSSNELLSSKLDPAVVSTIITFLNEQTGSHYRVNSEATKRKISARLREGFSVDDFKKVISTKTQQWKNDKAMSKYLRPETLFGTKFESYLNEGGDTDEWWTAYDK